MGSQLAMAESNQVLRALARPAQRARVHSGGRVPEHLVTAGRVSLSVTVFTANAKPRKTAESIEVERRYRNVINTFLAGQMPGFSHQRHVCVDNILRHLPYGRELMHLGLQTMTCRKFVVGK